MNSNEKDLELVDKLVQSAVQSIEEMVEHKENGEFEKIDYDFEGEKCKNIALVFKGLGLKNSIMQANLRYVEMAENKKAELDIINEKRLSYKEN